MKKINKTINFFTYDYPYEGNDSPFIEDEIKCLSNTFKKVRVIPIKKGKLLQKNFIKKNNIKYDFTLTNFFYSNSIFYILLNSLFSKFLWKEFFKAKFPFIFRKIFMIFKENFYSEIVSTFIKQNSFDMKKDIFFSFWSNFILISFYKLNINNCFARTLGSDLNGFLINDSFVPFSQIKFKNLKFILILNEGQKRKLLTEKLINEKKIIKSYLGVYPQNSLSNLNRNKNEIFFLSCGSLIEVKNTLTIIKFISNFAKQNRQINIHYTCIGNGHLKDKIKEKLINSSKYFKFKMIHRVQNLLDYLQKRKIDYIINFSFSEGVAFTNMEAMSCGIPVISNKIAGNLELINKQNGIICDLKKDPNFFKLNELVLKFHKNKKLKLDMRNKTLLTIRKKFNRKLSYQKFTKILRNNFN